jgi:septum site-determining protein MinC
VTAIPPLAIKGVKDGLLITLGPGEWPAVAEGLLARLGETPDFFAGAQLILQLGDRALGAADLGRLREQLSDHAVSLRAVLSEATSTQSAARALGLDLSLAQADEPDPEIDPEERGEDAMLLRRTLRSGRAVRHRGHVIIVGDVNAGAEIVAGGDVVVWGRIRGTVHAGAGGDEAAIICALDLAPTQLRIAGHIAISPANRGQPAPEIARLRDGHIVAEPWNR